MIQQIDPKLIAAGIGVLIALIEAARRFQMTGKIPLTQLPWTAKRQLFRWVRKSYFTVDRPDHASFVVDLTVDELEEVLGRQGFVPEWPLSYRYGGEVANLRLYFYEATKELPHRQVHVRAFEHENGLELMCHEEPTPDHHPQEHLESHDMAFEAANEFVKRRLENQVPVGYPGN